MTWVSSLGLRLVYDGGAFTKVQKKYFNFLCLIKFYIYYINEVPLINHMIKIYYKNIQNKL